MPCSSKAPSLSGIILSLWSVCCGAAPFGNAIGYAWADTPQGKFECRDDKSTNYLQVLKINGQIVFQEKLSPDGILEGETLAAGIEERGVGCPAVLANEKGYVVVVRDTQPPAFGLQGYAVIDFNKKDPALVSLVEGQRPQDSKISDKRRFQWSDKGLTLRYFGYLPGESGGSKNSPKPHAHEVFLDFVSGAVETIK